MALGYSQVGDGRFDYNVHICKLEKHVKPTFSFCSEASVLELANILLGVTAPELSSPFIRAWVTLPAPMNPTVVILGLISV